MHPTKSHDFEWDYGPSAKFPLNKTVWFSLLSIFIEGKDLVYERDSQVKLELERLNTLVPCYQPCHKEARNIQKQIGWWALTGRTKRTPAGNRERASLPLAKILNDEVKNASMTYARLSEPTNGREPCLHSQMHLCDVRSTLHNLMLFVKCK